ncbi:MAG: 16S rRNA (cytidine(1402)-2'-O)-methyltransferase [Acidobacteria bacterium]|nr:16S rRNA (cytidine(1402)-2'-O)-methyltransferase [Acidobacteriota bacterium]
MSETAAGTLFLVATPIGNLEDISLRALRVLREADLVAAEDTRHTGKLLHHYDIRTPTTSLHEHNEHEKVPALVDRLRAGARIALVTDAGTPSISDPGYRLTKAAIDARIRVEAIPGASAVMAALVASGLPTDSFVFAGFPPPKPKARAAWLEALRQERRTLVVFEAPHRIRETLTDAFRILGDRQVAIGRELTKLHEELVRSPISVVLEQLSDPRGEFTIVIAGMAEGDPIDTSQTTDNQLLTEFGHLTESGLGRRDALNELAARHGLRSREVFAAIDRARRS